MALSPRERVLMAVRGERPDRTPRDFWAETPALARVLRHTDGSVTRDDRPTNGNGGRLVDRDGRPTEGGCGEEELLQRLGIDMRHLEAPGPPEHEVGGGVWQNMWGERYVYRQTPWGPMREDVKGALSGAETLGDIEAFPWPSPGSMDHSVLTAQCDRWDKYALLYGFADIWQRPGLVRGWERMFLDMACEPEIPHYLSRRFTDFYLEDYARAAEATCGRIDIYLVISDLGSQSGPLISLPMFREFVAPYLGELVDAIHSFGGRAMFHSCGDVFPFIPDLLELGVDILDPIQPVSPEMSPERLAADFGGRLCFHGGIDMQRLLPHGTPAEVSAEARRYREALGAAGGYILAPAHLFQPDVPPENLLAVYA